MGIGGGTEQTRLVTELGRDDAHRPRRERESPFHHHPARRFEKHITHSSHPAADDYHLRIEDINHVHQAHAQIGPHPGDNIQCHLDSKSTGDILSDRY